MRGRSHEQRELRRRLGDREAPPAWVQRVGESDEAWRSRLNRLADELPDEPDELEQQRRWGYL